MLNADNGTYDSWYWAHPPMYMPQNCNLNEVAHIKKFVDIPVVCAGRMEPEAAAQAIAQGQIDGMGVARHQQNRTNNGLQWWIFTRPAVMRKIFP